MPPPVVRKVPPGPNLMETFEYWLDTEESERWRDPSPAGEEFRCYLRDKVTRDAKFFGKPRAVIRSAGGEEVAAWEIDGASP